VTLTTLPVRHRLVQVLHRHPGRLDWLLVGHLLLLRMLGVLRVRVLVLGLEPLNRLGLVLLGRWRWLLLTEGCDLALIPTLVTH